MIEKEIDHYLQRLFPINRSITGPGNRETLSILQEIVPLQIKEFTSGTQVYDWIIPDEWKINDAWIKDASGTKLLDFQMSNIHVVSYSEPIHKKMHFDELRGHLHTHPDLPDAIPYRTTYYKRNWGFCTTQAQYEAIEAVQESLEVYIDSEFNPSGSLSIGELLIPGECDEEILISTYICHPSLANDNLSGAVMTAFLARKLLKLPKPKKGYRIIWVPETIGAITYCAMNEKAMKAINTGMVVTTVGGPGLFGYKQSFNINHSINAVIEEIFDKEGIDYITYPFDIHGSDERQYSSQGFLINTASITKDRYYEYPYYHTSLDDLNFVTSDAIADSLELHMKVLALINTEPIYKNIYPNGEVMLSKHGLYPKTGGAQLPELNGRSELDLVLWLLWYSDGTRGLYGLARELGCSSDTLERIASKMIEKGVLLKVG